MIGMSTAPALIVEVTHEDGIWTAECDALGLVTEADTYDDLTNHAWEIAPELAELNGLDIDPEHLRLKFQQTETAANRLAP